MRNESAPPKKPIDNNKSNTLEFNFSNGVLKRKTAEHKHKEPFKEVLQPVSSNVQGSNQHHDELICSLCLTFIQAANAVTLKRCQHIFCRQCLTKEILNTRDLIGIVDCPFAMEPCGQKLTDEEVKKILSNDDYQTFANRSIDRIKIQIQAETRCLEIDMNDLDGTVNTMKIKPMKKQKPNVIKSPARKPDPVAVATNLERPLVEPPPHTPEDWEIFKQYTDFPEPKAPVYEELLELNNKQLVENHEEFICSLCLSFVPIGAGVKLKQCFHLFCRQCLITKINGSINVMGIVQCPLTIEACELHLQDEEIKEILGDDYAVFGKKVIELIKATISEEEANKHSRIPELLSRDLDFCPNIEAFECEVCYTEIEEGVGVMLKDCLHKFCRECIIGTVEAAEEFEVNCPGTCTFKMQEREIKAIVSSDVFEKHLLKSLKIAESATAKSYHCKTPDCNGWIEYEEGVRGFTCQVCLAVNCLGCKVIHKGKNCQEYQDEINPNARSKRENEASERAVLNMIAAKEAMFCPKCGIPVMKQDGCDYITCTACKLGICWVTQKPRLPFVKEGLTIDGCHCREGGLKCHPQCNHCH